MELIYQNPFRILGLPINAKDRQIAKRIGDLAIYTDMGKEIEYNVDHFFPDKPIRTPESIEEAKQKIDQPSNKLFYALFWFWENSNNTIDEMAFEELQNGNVEKAIEFWEKAIENGITAKNRSNHRNLATLKLGLSTHDGNLNKDTFLNSLSLSGEFLANGHFEEFTTQVLGEQYNVDLLETTSHYVDEIISIAKPHLNKQGGIKTNELIKHFEPYPDTIKNNIIEKFIGQHIHGIEKQINLTTNQLGDNARVANKLGFELYKNTQTDIKQLQAVFTKSDLKYQLIADKLSNEILNCSIAFFNELCDSNNDPSKDALQLVLHAKDIAIDEKTNDRIKKNYSTMKAWADEKPVRAIIKPLISKLEKYQSKVEKSDIKPRYEIAKEFVFEIKKDLDKIRTLIKREKKVDFIIDEIGDVSNQDTDARYKYIKNIISACSHFVNSCALDIANNRKNFGRAIELVDMAGKVLMYESSDGNNYTINKELSGILTAGRKTLSDNISNKEAGFTSLLFGGAIRTVKKRLKCGCGSGKNQKRCCSM